MERIVVGVNGSQPSVEALRWVIDRAMELSDLSVQPATTRLVIEGHPVEVLSQASTGVDLLMVGNRGHGGFAGLLLGSVSENVCSHAPRPVLVDQHIDGPQHIGCP